MCMTCLQKIRYGTWMVRDLHVRLLGAPQLRIMHDIHLDQLLLHTISWCVLHSEASPGCLMLWCKSTDTALDCVKRYIHPPMCTMVGGESRHMWLDKLCQMWEYCYQICASTSCTLVYACRYLICYPHLCFTCFHSHTSPHPTAVHGGTIDPTFDVHDILSWYLDWRWVLPYNNRSHHVRVREMTSLSSIF